MTLKIISQYRQELMGLAMLMVVYHHMPIREFTLVDSYMHLNGVFGVDIFLLLSGMGLYYSTRQGLNLIHYYRRRLLRIFPLYFAVVGIFSLLAGDSFLTYILKATTIGWWTSGATIGWWTPGDWYDWFIPNLILLYLTFPLFHAAVHNHRNGLLIGSVIVVGLYICVSFIPYGSFSIQFLRWPTFFLGALLGYAIFTSGDKRRIIDNILTDTTARGGGF